MHFLFRYFDVVPALIVSDALPLPDPNSFAVVGWAVVVLWGLVKIADSLLNFYKRHIKQSIPSGDWVTTKQMEALKEEVRDQLTENRTYVHAAVHEVNTKLDGIRKDGDSGREGLHNRLGTIVELVHYMRGQNEGMLKACEVSANAAERAAKSAERIEDATRRGGSH